MIDNIAHNIFLLMLNLSQIKSHDLIISIFMDAVNQLHEDITVKLVDEQVPHVGEIIEIATTRNSYGKVSINIDGSDLSEDIPALIRNTVRLLAIILEKNQQDKLLADEKIHLESAVKERTEQLENEIAKHKLTEQALADSEKKHRELTENLPQRIFHKDADSVYISCNRNYAHDLGILPEQIEGKTDFDFYPKELAEKYRADDQRLIKSGKIEDIEESYIRDDQELFVHTVKTPLTDKYGKVTGILGIFWDVTDRKKAEAEREKLLKTLTAKNKELQSIVYVTSHDLKSPLVNISGFSGELAVLCRQLDDLISENNFDGDHIKKVNAIIRENIPESLHYITASTRKMKVLLDGLLQFSRVGTSEINIERVDMNNVISSICKSMEFQFKERDTTVRCSELPNCIGDTKMVDQVFSNLFSNAIKYLSPERKGEITVSAQLNDTKCIYCVQDNGIGIPLEYQPKIFHLFHRLNPNDSKSGEGIGLAIVTRILDRLNGSINLESQPGIGSKFFISLPKG